MAAGMISVICFFDLLWLSVSAATSAGSCYTMASHQVSCDTPPADCNSSGLYWYAPGYTSSQSGCCHCKASCETVSSTCSYYDVSTGTVSTSTTSPGHDDWGCYDMSVHQCSCTETENSCAQPRVWTHSCTSCQSGGNSNGASIYGCYDVSVHLCACDDTETTCNQKGTGHTWTTGCNSCSSSSTTPAAPGCYNVQTQTCQCGGTEADCLSAGNTWTECTTCDSDSQSAGATKGNPDMFLFALCLLLVLAQSLEVPRSLGSGCYDHIDTHKCDCTVTEQHCTEVRGHTWTDGCRSCDATEGINHPECNKEHSWGCFDQQKHGCECEVSQATCNANMSSGKMWTHQCWSCCYTSEWGCYITGSGCHCSIPEGACLRDFPSATWSHQCHECNPANQAQPQVVLREDDSNVTAIVVIASSAGFAVIAIAIAGVILFRTRGKNTQPSQPAVVVGMPAGDNLPNDNVEAPSTKEVSSV